MEDLIKFEVIGLFFLILLVDLAVLADSVSLSGCSDIAQAR